MDERLKLLRAQSHEFRVCFESHNTKTLLQVILRVLSSMQPYIKDKIFVLGGINESVH